MTKTRNKSVYNHGRKVHIFITTAVIRRLANGITSGFTFVRAPTGMNGLTGRQYYFLNTREK